MVTLDYLFEEMISEDRSHFSSSRAIEYRIEAEMHRTKMESLVDGYTGKGHVRAVEMP